MSNNCQQANNAELEIRRRIAQLESDTAHYANLNDGGKWGHGAGNFSGDLARSRGQLECERAALRALTGGTR